MLSLLSLYIIALKKGEFKWLNQLISKYKNVPVEVKASIYYTICSIVQKCIVLITLPIFTRLMTTQQYGQYSIYQSWMNIVAIFATLNLQYGSFDTAMIKFENDRDRYISSIQGIGFSFHINNFNYIHHSSSILE